MLTPVNEYTQTIRFQLIQILDVLYEYVMI